VSRRFADWLLPPEQRTRASRCAAVAFVSPYFFATVNLGVLWVIHAVAPLYYGRVASTVMLVNATLGIGVAAIAGSRTPGPMVWRLFVAAFWAFAAAGISFFAAFILFETVGRAMDLSPPW